MDWRSQLRIPLRWLFRLGLLLIAVWFVWQLTIAVRILWWTSHNPEGSAFMGLRAEERARLHKPPIIPRPWVGYRQIPGSLKRAVIAAEDSKFVSHQGFDWEGIEFALRKDVRRGRLIAGGSTITQQLAKNLFLSERRSVFRKAEEALITLMLEGLWTKHRILEVYLNSIEWGDGLFGCEAASERYFKHPVSELTSEEAALMASMIPNPRFYDHHRSHPKLLQKQWTILMRMPEVAIPK